MVFIVVDGFVAITRSRYHCYCRCCCRSCRRHYRLRRRRRRHRNHRLSLGLAFRIAPRLALDERICNIHLPMLPAFALSLSCTPICVDVPNMILNLLLNNEAKYRA